MFGYKRTLKICFIDFFICVVIYFTYAIFHPVQSELIAGLLGFGLLAVNIALSCFPRLKKFMPYIIMLFFTLDCTFLTFFTGTAVYLPLVFICEAAALCFFVDPMVNIWFIACSNIAVLLAVMMYGDEIRRTIPLTIFCLLLFLYDFALGTITALIYILRTNIDRLNLENKSAKAQIKREKRFWKASASDLTSPTAQIDALCEKLFRENMEDSEREAVFEIQQHVRELRSALEEAVDYVRLENRDLIIENRQYVFSSMLSDIVNFCSARLENDRVKFLVDCDSDIPAEMVGDQVRIRQVVISLFANSVKFTSKGSITLIAKARPAGEGVNLQFSVIDTGVGLDRKAISNLFTVYSSGESGEAENEGKTTHFGLGMARELVTLMDGFIAVESTVGVGTRFSVTIPQKVVSALPFAQVENADKYFVLLYLKDISPTLVQKQFRQLKVKMEQCDSRADFMLKKENPDITHLFVDYDYYQFDRPIFDMLERRMRIIVPQRFGRPEKQLPDGIRKIMYPLYTASFASILNSGDRDPEDGGITFTASEAAVLVVDDSPVNLKVASTFLQPYGMKIYTAEGGNEAVELIKNRHVDLIFMDQVMPEPDGMETTRIIRSLDDPALSSIPIVALTANTQPDMKRIFLDGGMNDFLAKPLEQAPLDSVLKKWLPKELLSAPPGGSVRARRRIPEKQGYEVFDPERGIKALSGNEQAYLEVLQIFIEDYEETRNELNDAVFTGNMHRYAIRAHSLKGSAVSIGANTLSECARQLETAAKNDELLLVRERTPILLEMCEKVNKQISLYLSRNGVNIETAKERESLPAVEDGGQDSSPVSPKLSEIESAIESNDAAKAAGLLNAMSKKAITPSQTENVNQIVSAVNDFDFKEAKRLLYLLKQSFGKEGEE